MSKSCSLEVDDDNQQASQGEQQLPQSKQLASAAPIILEFQITCTTGHVTVQAPIFLHLFSPSLQIESSTYDRLRQMFVPAHDLYATLVPNAGSAPARCMRDPDFSLSETLYTLHDVNSRTPTTYLNSQDRRSCTKRACHGSGAGSELRDRSADRQLPGGSINILFYCRLLPETTGERQPWSWNNRADT
ncbi:hypothetical protein HD806DRAFT_449702 [Xylariaceae sp. AK1471]|nr:hypothetical protein HD806DRAFT_449702 [Xylariaceae sp. AK1471]